MKEFFSNLFSKENRKKTIIAAVAVVAVVGAVVVILTLGKPFGNNQIKRWKRQLNDRMGELAKNFYENYYYDQVGSEFVKGHAENGIKIDIANLARINNSDSQAILEEFKNTAGEDCDSTKSKVTIYPKDPYGKTDYELKIDLECNFNK